MHASINVTLTFGKLGTRVNPDTCRIRVDGQIFESGKKKYVWAAPYSLRATMVQGLASFTWPPRSTLSNLVQHVGPPCCM